MPEQDRVFEIINEKKAWQHKIMALWAVPGHPLHLAASIQVTKREDILPLPPLLCCQTSGLACKLAGFPSSTKAPAFIFFEMSGGLPLGPAVPPPARLFLRLIPLDLANLNNGGFVRLPNGAEGPRAPGHTVITLIPLPPPPPPPPRHPIPRLPAPARLITMGRNFGKGPTILPWAMFIIFAAVVADNYHYHSHGQDNRIFEATLLVAGVALLAFIAYVLSNLYECICKEHAHKMFTVSMYEYEPT
ncbi:hypothetical protein DFP72DRAFT_851369 [Ephemerocybe angulata]|uniref:Uncharacterized protein n=1 Tax=Ephemerocybe angulata TaxID=980116 RepID=A0A8H6HS79_9AGAR|nr:hypothetical protein DFP72DRAFT_851369 [Tulosesus angulatus]